MKNLKTTVALVISIFLLIITLPTVTYNAAELRYGRTILQKMDNSQALLAVYDRLVDGCKDAKETISFENLPNKINSTELSSVYRIFYADYPEYFWLNGGYSYTQTDDKTVISITPTYTLNGSSLKTAKSAFEKKVNELIKNLGTKSDYEKSLILHDRLIDTADYIVSKNDQSAYGALVEGKAVCSGYSKAYQHLLHKVGIPAWCVIGTGKNPSTSNVETHEWNLVLINGNWYYTDTTWDDLGKDIFYEHFNITTKQLEETHSILDFKEYLPKATATDANYFVKNNQVYSEFDLNTLATNLENGDNKTRLYITSDTKAFLTNLSNNFFALMKKMGIPDEFGYSYTTTTLNHETILTVKIIEPNHQHKLTIVPAKAASCTSKGSIAYYTCSCGKWFTDSAAVTEITDKQSVVLPAVAHTPSGWKSDSNNHWKICTNCNAEIANSAQPHTDADKNIICDICAYLLPIPETKPTNNINSNADDNVSNNSNSNNESKQQQTISGANSESKQPQTESTTNNNVSQIFENSSTDTVTKEESSTNETSSDTTSSVTQDTAEDNTAAPKTNISLPQIIIACATIVSVSAISVIVFIKKRRL